MTQKEFADKIREKYKGSVSSDGRDYSSIPDNELVQKIIEKFPVYKTQISDLQSTQIETPKPKDEGFLSSEISKAGEKFSPIFEKQTPLDEKISLAGQMPLTSAGIGARALTELVSKPIVGAVKGVSEIIGSIPIVQKISQSKFGDNLEAGINDIAQRSSFALEQIKNKVTPEVFDSLKDSVEIATWMSGLKPAQTAVKNTSEIVKSVANETLPFLKNVSEQTKNIVMKPIEKGKDILTKVAQEPIPKPVENVLKETSTEIFDKYASAGVKAVENFKNPTPLEVVGGKAEESLTKIQEKLSSIGKQKSDVMGIGGVGTQFINSKIITNFNNKLQSFLNSKLSVEGDNKLIKDIITETKKITKNPTANQIDKFIDFVQDKIYTSTRDLTVPVTDRVASVLRKLTGELNSDFKKQLPDSYSKLNSKYSKLIEIRNELNTKLGKDGERGGSLMKRVFSPSDARTKELFKEVLDETGIDLVNEATLARYVMEVLGDARQTSLLEQLKLPRMSGKGILEFVWDKVNQRLNTPEELLRKARAMTSNKIINTQ